MAKGSNDVILRDRLQFDIDATGNTNLVYGRVDLSDYVSIPESKGLAIKEIRFQLRTRVGGDSGVWPNYMGPRLAASMVPTGTYESAVKLFATTTAYEDVVDVGVGSPNVICVFDKQSLLINQGTGANVESTAIDTYEHMFGTPDLHPEGYDVVTDLLIGIELRGVNSENLVSTTCEVDVMIIAEPKKITSKDLTQMLSQAQDV
ncbi:MAG: hypothetical protein HKO72_12160 [Flavobacteriaceae bacterium]|nr:hypothetical protein [Flavobacteriaceae bacterium]